jgi:hypothetical protein
MWPRWKGALERLLKAKADFDGMSGLPDSDPAKQAAAAEYGLAAVAYNKVSADLY